MQLSFTYLTWVRLNHVPRIENICSWKFETCHHYPLLLCPFSTLWYLITWSMVACLQGDPEFTASLFLLLLVCVVETWWRRPGLCRDLLKLELKCVLDKAHIQINLTCCLVGVNMSCENFRWRRNYISNEVSYNIQKHLFKMSKKHLR